jgi:hypothetical protein
MLVEIKRLPLGGRRSFVCSAALLQSVADSVWWPLKRRAKTILFEAIAHGIGWYCIGKGLFMIAIPFQAKQTLLEILRGPSSGSRV